MLSELVGRGRGRKEDNVEERNEEWKKESGARVGRRNSSSLALLPLLCPTKHIAKWHSHTAEGLEIEMYLQGHHKTLHTKVILD